jgi:hypothetical protein
MTDADDRTAALTGLADGVQDGVTEALLREQIAEALTRPLPEWRGGTDALYWLARADAVLAVPAVRDLLALRGRVATLAVCPTLCDDNCEATCHEAHDPWWKRIHQPHNCPSAALNAKTER